MKIVSSLLVEAGGYLPGRSPPEGHLRVIYLQINYAVLLFFLRESVHMAVQQLLCLRHGLIMFPF